jgi:putative zinc finger/helix-turn-helix YgiT family protein
MEKLNCSECKEGVLVERTGDYETTYRDRNERSHRLIVPEVTWLECDKCGDVTLDDRAMSAIETARRGALGILSPDKIRAFRMSLQKTQGAMSALLGIGEKTYTRWESGAYIQSEAFDRYLRLLMENDENLVLLQRITNLKKEKLEPGKAMPVKRAVFDQLSDVARVEEQSRVFVDLLVQGALYVH